MKKKANGMGKCQRRQRRRRRRRLQRRQKIKDILATDEIERDIEIIREERKKGKKRARTTYT